jgi:hypothetical protein
MDLVSVESSGRCVAWGHHLAGYHRTLLASMLLFFWKRCRPHTCIGLEILAKFLICDIGQPSVHCCIIVSVNGTVPYSMSSAMRYRIQYRGTRGSARSVAPDAFPHRVVTWRCANLYSPSLVPFLGVCLPIMERLDSRTSCLLCFNR